MSVFQWTCTGVLLSATAALACPVCGLPSEQGEGAYIFMTGIMSVLPLLLGGIVVGVWLYFKRADKTMPGAVPAHANACPPEKTPPPPTSHEAS